MCGDALRSFAPAQDDDPRFRAATTAKHLILLAAPFVALATWFVINVLFELFGSERSYASNFGVSISRCQEVFRIIGTPENGQCSRRLPRETRTELQLAVEVIAMKIERQEMRGKRQVPLWYAPEGLARP
jgi:hypothetical protein